MKLRLFFLLILSTIAVTQDNKIPGTRELKDDKLGRIKAELLKLKSEERVIQSQYTILQMAENQNQAKQQSKLNEIMALGKIKCGDDKFNPKLEDENSDGMCMPAASEKKEPTKK
jgi:hypothetical protein